MTDVAVDCLRIRGPGARRLAGVAARVLPAALERALADLADVQLDSITVHLDPADHDDHTLAALWADAIRAQALAAGARTTLGAVSPRSKSAPSSTPDAPPLSAATHWSMAETIAATASWLGKTPTDQDALPQILLTLARPEVAAGVRSALGASAWQRLISRLGVALTAARTEELPESPTEAGVPPAEPSMDPALLPGPDAIGRLSAATSPASEVASESAAAEVPLADPQQLELLRRLGALAELVEGTSDPVDLTTVTRAAGLILLWPWLADVCREAEALHPREDPARVRVQALAQLADPGDLSLVADPLIRFLAGAAESDDVASPCSGLDAITDSALASFAALLPGFGASTPRFVRDQWVLRLGILDATSSPARLVAATHPLDVLLSQLPYPLSLFKLPWSPMLSVRFRP